MIYLKSFFSLEQNVKSFHAISKWLIDNFQTKDWRLIELYTITFIVSINYF